MGELRQCGIGCDRLIQRARIFAANFCPDQTDEQWDSGATADASKSIDCAASNIRVRTAKADDSLWNCSVTSALGSVRQILAIMPIRNFK